jgi:hypothetical protein
MSNFDFSLGKDGDTLILIGPDGLSQIDIQYVKDFEPKQDKTDIVVKGLDGRRHTFYAPEGWSGSFTVTRRNPALDDFFTSLESDWFEAGIASLMTIYHYVTEKDGTQRGWMYTNCTLHLSSAGKWEQDSKPVEQKVDFSAERKEPV